MTDDGADRNHTAFAVLVAFLVLYGLAMLALGALAATFSATVAGGIRSVMV